LNQVSVLTSEPKVTRTLMKTDVVICLQGHNHPIIELARAHRRFK